MTAFILESFYSFQYLLGIMNQGNPRYFSLTNK